MGNSTTTRALAVLTVGTVVFTGALSLGQAAEEREYTPKAESRSLVTEALPGDPSKTVIIKEFQFPPGYVGARHSHTGAVYVYVIEGELTLEIEGSDPQTVEAGQLFQEPLQTVMHASNQSAGQPVRIVVFQVGETGKPMMIKAQ